MFWLTVADPDFEAPDLEALPSDVDTDVPFVEPPDVGSTKFKFHCLWAIALILSLSLLMWLRKQKTGEEFYDCEPMYPERIKKDLKPKQKKNAKN